MRGTLRGITLSLSLALFNSLYPRLAMPSRTAASKKFHLEIPKSDHSSRETRKGAFIEARQATARPLRARLYCHAAEGCGLGLTECSLPPVGSTAFLSPPPTPVIVLPRLRHQRRRLFSRPDKESGNLQTTRLISNEAAH